MPISDRQAWRYAAAQYLWIWLKVDRDIVREFRDPGPTAGALARLLQEYRASRTIPGNGPRRLEPFVRILSQACNSAAHHPDVVEMITRTANELRNIYDRNCLSAVSKAYWMLLQHPVAILDTLATQGLKRSGRAIRPNDYTGYHAAWFDYFTSAEIRKQIDGASVWLPDSRYAQSLVACGATTSDQIRRWAKSAWFRNRVADQRLVLKGSRDGDDIVHPADLARFLGPEDM